MDRRSSARTRNRAARSSSSSPSRFLSGGGGYDGDSCGGPACSSKNRELNSQRSVRGGRGWVSRDFLIARYRCFSC